MIDELAKAFCCNGACQKRIGEKNCFAPFYRDGVANVLRRLREPTPEMIGAGIKVYGLHNPVVRFIWEAMIDAAMENRHE